jgi:hypothetical protein
MECPKDYEVIVEHKASFPYSVELKAGDRVTLSDKEEDRWIWCLNKDGLGAWVPKDYLTRQDHTGVVLFDYNSSELNAKIGERLESAKEASDWLWCTNQEGQRGWIPRSKVRKLCKHG